MSNRFFYINICYKNLAASPLYLNHSLCFIKTSGINQKCKTMTLRVSIWNFTLITIEKTHSDPINAREAFKIILFCTKTLLRDKYWIIQSIFFLPTWAFSREWLQLTISVLHFYLWKYVKVLTKIEKSMVYSFKSYFSSLYCKINIFSF